MTEFDKWWNDPKKHYKRLNHWLPHWKKMAARIGEARRMRYFTLCARSMIDVFMLVKEGLLELDKDNFSIGSVQFCEYDFEQFNEIRDLIAREGAGFYGVLEDVLLFENDDFTGQYPTLDSIALKLEEAEGMPETDVEKLQLKRTHLNVRASFPYDYVNLDFCQYYYKKPPGMLRINSTVQRVLDWQLMPSADGQEIQLDDFLLAVTCRHDEAFPQEAEARLAQLIKDNCNVSPEYKQAFEQSRGGIAIDEWAKQSREDFFFAGWPKDIARGARERGWAMEILDYVYYRRTGDEQNPYLISCLVAKFSRTNIQPDYIPTALYALRGENRKLIGEIERDSEEGQKILIDLANVVAVRNEQARRVQRPELPAP